MKCPECGCIFSVKEQWINNAERRRNLILKQIKDTHKEVIPATTLYREVRKHGYSMKWKTFYRDLQIMKMSGQIKTEVRKIKNTKGTVIIK